MNEKHYRYSKDIQNNHKVWAILEKDLQDGKDIYLVWWQTTQMPRNVTEAKRAGLTSWEWAENLNCDELLEKFNPAQTHFANASIQRNNTVKKSNSGRISFERCDYPENELKTYITLWDGGYNSVFFYARVMAVHNEFKRCGWVRQTGGLPGLFQEIVFIHKIFLKWNLSREVMKAQFFPRMVAKNLTLKGFPLDPDFGEYVNPCFAPITSVTAIPLFSKCLTNSSLPLMFIYSGQTGIMPDSKQHALLVIILKDCTRNMFIYDPFVSNVDNETPPKDLRKMRLRLCPTGKIYQGFGTQSTGTDCLIRVLYLAALILAGFDFRWFIKFVRNQKHG